MSRVPILDFQWAQDSLSLWVIAADGADEPLGLLGLDGAFQRASQGAAMRGLGGLHAANGLLAWVQSDGKQHGTIWLRERDGKTRVLLHPNPQIAEWDIGVQEVFCWKNAHQELLQGILARPTGGTRPPLIVDPYSNWRNRFLHNPSLGNYFFVQRGFAVFFPNHRAPHAFPAMAFGDAYVGGSKQRDPVDVLTDDVMSGVDELIRLGLADPDRLFLYSSSNGASAINQLLTQTKAFRAAVSHGGVADWLGYYQERHALGDETIPGFLGGKRPSDALELYHRISPLYHADKIATPLLLAIGEKDRRFPDTVKFYEALRQAGRAVTLVNYPDEGHEIGSAVLAEKHVQRALDFFRTSPASPQPPARRNPR